MVWFRSLLDQFVSSSDRANGLPILQFDAFEFVDFSAKILIDGFIGLGTVVMSLISENPRSRFISELMLLLC